MSDFFSRFKPQPTFGDVFGGDFLSEEERKRKATADFLRNVPAPTKGTVETAEEFRPADEEKLKKHAGTLGLGAVIEGGLNAVAGQEVPAELAAAAGERGDVIDMRDQTDLEVSDGSVTGSYLPFVAKKSSAVGEGITRGVEAARRGFGNYEERRAQAFGVGPDVRELAPQRAVEDTVQVAPADTFGLKAIDFAGEVAPEVVASLAASNVAGATKAVAGALEGTGQGAVRNWAAKRAADVALGTAENFFSAAVPVEDVPKVAGATLAFSVGLSALPGGAKLAKYVLGGQGDEFTAPLSRTLAEMAEESVESNLSRAFTEATEEAYERSLRAPAFPSSVTGAPADSLSGAFSARGPSRSSSVASHRTGVEDLLSVAESKGIPMEVSAGKFVVDGIEVRTAQEAVELLNNPRARFSRHLSDSVRNYLGDESDAIVERVTAKLRGAGSKAEGDFGMAVAAAEGKARANIVKAVDALDEKAMTASLGAATDPVSAGVMFLRNALNAADDEAGRMVHLGAFKATKNSNMFKEFYINASLTNLSTHLVNQFSNALQLVQRTAGVGVEGGIGDAAKAVKWLGVDVDPAVANKSITDVAPLIAGYARGAKTYVEVLAGIGQNIREHGHYWKPTRAQANAVRLTMDTDNNSFAENGYNTLRALWALTDDGGDQIANELDRRLAQKFGGNVNLGSIATDARLGAQGAIRGRLGAAIRTPTNALQGADSFFKAINFQGERAALVKRAAKARGMDVSDFINPTRPSQLIDPAAHANWESHMAELQSINDQAAFLAQYNTFTNELGKLGNSLKAVRDNFELPLHFGNGYKIGDTVYRPSIPIGTIYQPFMQTPINITKNFLWHSPVGLGVGASRAVLQGFNEQAVRELSQGIVGTGLMMTAHYFISNGTIDLRARPRPGADARTEEMAGGGQYAGADWVLSDGTRVPLNRFGPPGLYFATAADINRKMLIIAENELLNAEALEARGALSPERLKEIRDAVTEQSIMDVLMSEHGKDIALTSAFSAFANNVWNETSIADSIELAIGIGRANEDPTRVDGLIDDFEQKMANAVQPVAIVNTLAKAEQGGEIRVPTDEAGLGDRFTARIAQRLPFVEPPEGSTRNLVDLTGNVRKSRFGGDTSKSTATRFLGASLGPFAHVVGLNTPDYVGEERRDNGVRLAKEMMDVGISKNFPFVSSTLKKDLAMSSQVEQQAQMVKGQYRAEAVLPLIDSDYYQQLKADDKEAARAMLEQALGKADAKANKAIEAELRMQAYRKEPLDLSKTPLAEQYDFPPITAIEEKPNPDGILFRQQ